MKSGADLSRVSEAGQGPESYDTVLKLLRNLRKRTTVYLYLAVANQALLRTAAQSV